MFRWLPLLLFAWLSAPGDAFPHALDPESMDRHAEITLTPSQAVVVFQVMCGINGTEKATALLDADGDGEITDQERDAALASIAQKYADKQILSVDNQRLDLEYKLGDAYGRLGHNGINIIKIDLVYIAQYPSGMARGATVPFRYEDQNFQKVSGWKQMQLATRDGARFGGFVPYTEYQPFDYEIINTKGFYPSTESIEGEINIPNAAATVVEEFTLPERKDIIVETQSNFGPLYIVLALFAAVILIVLATLAVMTKQSKNPDHPRFD